MRFSTPMTAAPVTRRKAGENEQSGAGRQKAGSLCRHRLGRPPSARRATALERGKAFFLFGPAAARFSFWQDKNGVPAAPRAVGRGGAAEGVRPGPAGRGERFGACADGNGGWDDPAIIMAESPRRTAGLFLLEHGDVHRPADLKA